MARTNAQASGRAGPAVDQLATWLRPEVDTMTQGGRLYPPDDERQAMRDALLEHLRSRPAHFTASELVGEARANGAAKYPERDLKLELSRMLGSFVRMNPNRTLSAK